MTRSVTSIHLRPLQHSTFRHSLHHLLLFVLTLTETSSPARVTAQPKRGFSPEYVIQIEKYFEKTIENKKPASLGDCRKFLSKFPSDKTPKQVQDKVKNLVKSAK